MAILNFNMTSSRAFLTGFEKGFTAPANLYTLDAAPVIPKVEEVKAHVTNVDFFAKDVERITTDIYNVALRNDKK